MPKRILILGGTGMLGKPVTNTLAGRGHLVRLLTRNCSKARQFFGNEVEPCEGSALRKDHLRAAMQGCDAVHISLTQDAELVASQHIADLAPGQRIERVSYVSATSVCEENRWFEVVAVKMQAEEALRRSGVPVTIFRPTWVMETLTNFVRGNRAMIIIGNKPPPIHFVAATDFGRMVGDSYEDDRALGKTLYVHGPQGLTLPEALESYIAACHPESRTIRMGIWKARLLARLVPRLDYVTRLIAFFD